MDLLTVMTEIDTRLKTINQLNVQLGYSGKLGRVPAAVQYPPDTINYDETYGRGSDSYTGLLVVVFVQNNTPRQSLNDIGPYLAGSGARSIKAKLEPSAAAPYASCSDVRVVSADIDPQAVIGGNSYLAALFTCNIYGVGA